MMGGSRINLRPYSLNLENLIQTRQSTDIWKMNLEMALYTPRPCVEKLIWPIPLSYTMPGFLSQKRSGLYKTQSVISDIFRIGRYTISLNAFKFLSFKSRVVKDKDPDELTKTVMAGKNRFYPDDKSSPPFFEKILLWGGKKKKKKFPPQLLLQLK